MNRQLLRSASFSTIWKLNPCVQVSKRFHSTYMLTNTASNANDRLRVNEDEYCNSLSTPFKQSYRNVYDTLVRDTIQNFDKPQMMVSELNAKLLSQLVAILRPKRVLEIGGFTGSSAIALGSTLSSNAKLVSLELDPRHIETAKKYVKQANLQDKVEFREGPASDSIIALAEEPTEKKQFDLIFLDADKGGYIEYFELVMKHDLLSENGVIIADNVLYFGQVHRVAGYDQEGTVEVSKNIKKTAEKIDKFNKHVFKDPRVEVVMLPIFDGISIIRKKTE